MPPLVGPALTHPENGAWLVDRLGEKVRVGDTVIIARKSSSAYGCVLGEAVVKKITPLMIHPRYGGYDPLKWYNTSTRSGYPLVREDQLHKSRPTEYLHFVAPGASPDWSKCFVATVQVPGMGRLHTIPFGDNLIAKP